MNSTLSIGPLSGTLVSDEKQTAASAQEITFGKESGQTKNAIRLRWSSCRFEELLDGILAFLTVVYLMGALGFGGLLLFYILHN